MYCERCQVKRKVDGERFCLSCRKKVLAEMRADGYLEAVPKTKHERARKPTTSVSCRPRSCQTEPEWRGTYDW